MLKVFVVFLCLILVHMSFSESLFSTPVLIWGAISESKPAFPPLRQNEFADIIRPLLKRHMVVAFLEQDLTTKDFLCHQPHTKKSCYTHLQQAHPKTYYAAVYEPLEALHTFMALPTRHVVTKHGQLERPIRCKVNSIKLIKFDADFPTRLETLTSHDNIMGKISMSLTCPVVYLYMCNTGAITTDSNIQKRMRRQDPESPVSPEESSQAISIMESATNQGGQILKGERFVMFYSKLLLRDKAKETVFEITNLTEQATDPKISITLNTNVSKPLTFDVEAMGGYYIIHRFAFNGIIYHAQDVETPEKFSYYCSSLSIRHTGTVLEWTNLQFQVQSRSGEEFKSFNEAWHCAGFFSAGIISGVFIMGFVLSITFCGICWIMDIKSVDRFENPRGKSIHITATD